MTSQAGRRHLSDGGHSDMVKKMEMKVAARCEGKITGDLAHHGISIIPDTRGPGDPSTVQGQGQPSVTKVRHFSAFDEIRTLRA